MSTLLTRNFQAFAVACLPVIASSCQGAGRAEGDGRGRSHACVGKGGSASLHGAQGTPRSREDPEIRGLDPSRLTFQGWNYPPDRGIFDLKILPTRILTTESGVRGQPSPVHGRQPDVPRRNI